MGEHEPENAQAVAECLRWRSHPVVDDYPRSLGLIAVVTAVCVATGASFEGVGYGLLAAAFLVGSLARYFVPTYYEFDPAGVSVRFLGRVRRIPWGHIRRFAVHAEGVQMSPFERPSRLEAFRGTFVRFAGNRDEVVSFVEGQMAAHREA